MTEKAKKTKGEIALSIATVIVCCAQIFFTGYLFAAELAVSNFFAGGHTTGWISTDMLVNIMNLAACGFPVVIIMMIILLIASAKAKVKGIKKKFLFEMTLCICAIIASTFCLIIAFADLISIMTIVE